MPAAPRLASRGTSALRLGEMPARKIAQFGERRIQSGRRLPGENLIRANAMTLEDIERHIKLVARGVKRQLRA